MEIKQVLNDYLLVELEPVTEIRNGLHLINAEDAAIKIAKVLDHGPGRFRKDVFHPIPTIVGSRVVFMAGASDTRSGKQLQAMLSRNRRFIRYDDVLGIIDPDTKVDIVKCGW